MLASSPPETRASYPHWEHENRVQYPVAEAVDRADLERGEIALVSQGSRPGREAVRELAGGLLGEGAEHDLPGSALPDRRRFRVLKTSEKVLPDPDRP
jgi:hypothetical protein